MAFCKHAQTSATEITNCGDAQQRSSAAHPCHRRSQSKRLAERFVQAQRRGVDEKSGETRNSCQPGKLTRQRMLSLPRDGSGSGRRHAFSSGFHGRMAVRPWAQRADGDSRVGWESCPPGLGQWALGVGRGSRSAVGCRGIQAGLLHPQEQIIHGRSYQNLAKLRAAVATFDHAYNHHWRRKKLRHQSPIQARLAFHSAMP